MIQLSHKNIIFSQQCNEHKLKISNQCQYTIIFKIKTNSLDILHATPIRGFISKCTSQIITVRTTAIKQFKAKLQISFSKVNSINDFNTLWGKLKSIEIQNEVIEVKKLNNKKSQSHEQIYNNGSNMINREQSHTYCSMTSSKSNDIQKEQKINWNQNNNHNSMQYIETQKPQNICMTYSLIYPSTNMDKNNHPNSLQLQLQNQLIINQNLIEQLRISKLKNWEAWQYRINEQQQERKVNNNCQSSFLCTNFINWLLFGIFCFIIGFMISAR